ncbi:MAG: hypothetical protein WC781_05830 [Candidatus Pacearchaeota archaeon]|jgi:hypothetical protein
MEDNQICENCGHEKKFHYDDNGNLSQCFRSYVDKHNCVSKDCQCKQFVPKKAEENKKEMGK